MSKILLAQALIPIADELDDKGLHTDASEIDQFIHQIISADTDVNMIKNSQYDIYGRQIDPQSGLPLPLLGQTKDEWFASLNPGQRFMVHQQAKQNTGAGTWTNTVAGDEARGVFEKLDWAKPNQQNSQQQGNTEWQFVGNDINEGKAWYRSNKTGQYYYSGNGTYYNANQLPGRQNK